MTADEIFTAILAHHGTPGQQWAVLQDVRCSTGYDSPTGGGVRRIYDPVTHIAKSIHRPHLRPSGLQMIDAFAIDLFPSHFFARVAYEIKISRSDFLREIKNPVKRRYAFSLAHRFFFIAPAGLINPEEVPLDCGLAWVLADGCLKVIRRAPKHECQPLPESFIAVVARRAAKAEAGLRKMGTVSVPPSEKDVLKT